MSATKKKAAASIVWFEIPADDLDRAKTFYNKLFGWKIAAIPGMPDYLHIDTGGEDASPDGGMMARKCPQQSITNYVTVPSVATAATKVKKLGAKSAWGRPPCHRWAILSFVRTRKVTSSPCGRRAKRQNRCPERYSSFVVLMNGRK